MFLLPLIYYGLYFAQRGQLPEKPYLIAHRGGPAQAPENTLLAFRSAIEIGADWLELDVQMSRDGVLVVIHDETVDRTTNGTGQVRELTLAEIRSLDAGKGEQVPTFEEVLALAKQFGVGVMPEAKAPHLYPGVEAKIAQAIMEANFVEKTVVQSFDGEALEALHKLNPEIQLCKLYGLWELSLRGPQAGQANTVCPMAEMVVLNPWMLKQAQAEGRQAFVWFGVIEHPVVMRLILAMGADGLMVDDPRALANVLGR